MPLVSILLRTRNAGVLFDSLLTALATQTVTDRELVVVDSGSTDGTLERARAAGARVITLAARDFTHAVSTNLGFREARAEYVVSLSQDATPTHPEWLARLLDGMRAPDVAAVFGRQRARPGCFVVERMELARAYPEDQSGHDRVLFSNVNSIVRRSLWEKHPFSEAVAIAEDLEWARWAVAGGYRVVYRPDADVWHSHDYTLGQFYRRCREEGKAMSEFSGFRPGLLTIFVGWPRRIMTDFQVLKGWGELSAWPRASLYRLVQLVGSYQGSRSAGLS